MSDDTKWIEVHNVIIAALRTADDIRYQLDPTFEQYFAELQCGWRGSDGSSNSPDTIWGLRVGMTTTDYHPELPTWCHDLDYRALRRMVVCGTITAEEAESLRQLADQALLLRLIRKIESGTVLLRAVRRRRALKYYEGVHEFGSRYVLHNPEELYPCPAPQRAA